jgi:uncharacterized iron-regulated membrane protein
MLVPLFIIALSGVVMSFPWANNAVYAAFGEEPPQRGGPPAAPGAPGATRPGDTAIATTSGASLQQLFDAAATQLPDWQRITLPLEHSGARVELGVELKSEERRPPRRTVVLDAASATLVELRGANAPEPTAGQSARTWFRFAHTGEQYGVVGQTLAGLASLAACFLVYTGFALAWRRLVRPLFRHQT